MPYCERKGCGNYFNHPDHPHQRFCSKSCAKKGTQNRHKGLLNELEEGALERALLLVEQGKSYKVASKMTGIASSTIGSQWRIRKRGCP